MSEKLAAFCCAGRVLTAAEYNVPPDGVGQSVHLTRGLSCWSICMNAHGAKIMAETGFKESA